MSYQPALSVKPKIPAAVVLLLHSSSPSNMIACSKSICLCLLSGLQTVDAHNDPSALIKNLDTEKQLPVHLLAQKVKKLYWLLLIQVL